MVSILRTSLPLLILLSLFLSACSQSNEWELHHERKAHAQEYKPIPANFRPRDITVVSAGDSLTEGIGDSTDQGGYIPYIKTMLEKEKGINKVKIYNFGVKGNRTTQLLKRIESADMKAAIKKADMVILTIGGNDIMKVLKDNISNLKVSIFSKEKEVYKNHLHSIMDEIIRQNPDVSIVLIGMYNPFSQVFSNIQEMNDIIAEWNQAGQLVVANYPNAYFVSIEDLFLNPKEDLLYTDHFHPNDKGYQLIAERLNQTLEVQTIPDLEKKSLMVSKEEN
jgi:lysophospholipase L1-like esterase